MSGHAGSLLDGFGLDPASYAFLQKPMDINDLLEIAGSVLNEKRYHL
ncbi:MAG: hypothetical protein ACI9WS_001898 [Paraglaciecola psychrophila]|jgi:hypothetical protein